MGWRTHFLHMAANYRPKKIMKIQMKAMLFLSNNSASHRKKSRGLQIVLTPAASMLIIYNSVANAAKIIISYYKPAEPMWLRARRRPQQRNIDFLQKIIVCPCILSNLPCSSVQFIQLFWTCILSIFQFLKFSAAKWF